MAEGYPLATLKLMVSCWIPVWHSLSMYFVGNALMLSVYLQLWSGHRFMPRLSCLADVTVKVWPIQQKHLTIQIKDHKRTYFQGSTLWKSRCKKKGEKIFEWNRSSQKTHGKKSRFTSDHLNCCNSRIAGALHPSYHWKKNCSCYLLRWILGKVPGPHAAPRGILGHATRDPCVTVQMTRGELVHAAQKHKILDIWLKWWLNAGQPTHGFNKALLRETNG